MDRQDYDFDNTAKVDKWLLRRRPWQGAHV